LELNNKIKMKLDTNDLRAIAAIILLILAIALMFSQHEVDVVNYIALALAGFLIGGQVLGKNTDPTQDNGSNKNSA
jgi:hypothetical protein